MTEIGSTRKRIPSYRQFFVGAVLFLFSVNLFVVHQYFVLSKTDIMMEDALVENLTAAFYLIASFLLFLRAPQRAPIEQFLTLFFANTCLTLFLREVDIEDRAVPNFLIAIGSGTGRNILLSTIFLLILVFYWQHYRAYLHRLPALFKTPIAIITLAGCGLLFLGELCEKLGNLPLEEMLEMNGAFLIFSAAILYLLHPQLLARGLRKTSKA